MKIIKCGDLGFKCNFMAAGNELEEVENDILDHIEKEHKKKSFRICPKTIFII